MIGPASAQRRAANLVYADKQGVLRYTANKAEASFFGVNYTTPFAHAYRAQKALGIDLEQAIRNDVYHFARLGFDAFRVHVWDTEISDSAGNLLENEHLRLFDFLLAELKRRNIKTIVTPIAFWGNGYPERDEATPGFSRHFGRGKLTSNDTAIRAQENYLRQFFQHVNPYTRLTYEGDKDIIAVEINNEPSHADPKRGVTDYINRLMTAIKATGWSKPVFYNIAQGPYFSDAVAASKVDGFSFQWYPSGLVGNQTLAGNTLQHVDQYRIPFRDTVPAFKNRALMVYEFDAADIMNSYMYPAMARSFRGAGFQWATQFAYDPMGMAAVNTEYQTHYLNLAYTPSKAISMLIASEVFHRVPRGKSYGVYPADSSFDVFRVSYAQALSEMNTAEKFYYSNHTQTAPVTPEQLRHIAGVGSSPVVQYEGTGAYFLDKIADGQWRLEVMPDVIYSRDPFEPASPRKEVTAVHWADNRLQVKLAGLGDNFSVRGLNTGNDYAQTAAAAAVRLGPGTYLLSRAGQQAPLPATLGVLEMDAFVAPKPVSGPQEIIVRHQPEAEISTGQSWTIHCTISGIDSGRVTLALSNLGGGLYRNIAMKRSGYEWSAEVPAELVTTGQLQYRILVQEADRVVSFPGAVASHSRAWDRYGLETFKTNIASPASGLALYVPAVDQYPDILPNFRRGFQAAYVSGEAPGSLLYSLSMANREPDEIMGLQTFVGKKLQARLSELNAFKGLVVRARTDSADAAAVHVALVDQYGMAYAAEITVTNTLQDIELPLSALRPEALLLLPRPFPSFQPVYFKPAIEQPVFNLAAVERLQVYTGAAQLVLASVTLIK